MLVIPKSALYGADSVKVNRDGNEKMVAVVRGVQTLEEVEIISGIDSTTELILK